MEMPAPRWLDWEWIGPPNACMTFAPLATAAALAPLIVALACLVAWSRLSSGRHLLFWALGHLCLSPTFAIAGFIEWRSASPVFVVASVLGVNAIVFIVAGMRILVGRNDSFIAVLLAAAATTLATIGLQQLNATAYYATAPLITAAILFYGGVLALLYRRSFFYTTAGVIMLIRGALSVYYASELVQQAPSLHDAFGLSILINLTTGLALIMIEFDNARQREARARQDEQGTRLFFETMLDSMPATMTYKDTELRYRAMNRRMRELQQDYKGDYLGKTWSEIVGPIAAKLVEDIDRQVLTTGEPTHMEQAWAGPDGRNLVIWAMKVPLRDADGRIMGVITCGIDITRQKETEAMLIEQREAAETASRVKTSFLANMSHELRTPLNAIIGFADMMAAGYAGSLSQRQHDYAINIRESGEHLLRLVNDILDLSRLENGRLDIQAEDCDFDQIAQSALAMVQPQARQADVTLEFSPAQLMLRADPRALTQILVNLLGNAVKFNKPGGRVALTAETSHGVTRIRVSDTGIGMSETESRAVVQPLHRTDVYRSRANSGAGLGLSICRSLVELHGGRLDITSHPGEGTTVEIALPA
jgi:PAS domain S-box-containing protein